MFTCQNFIRKNARSIILAFRIMSSVIKASEILFKIALFGLLTQMIYEQAKIYIDNDDVSSLLFKKFQHHQEDIYPTFSICVVYYDGGLFRPKLGESSKGYWNFIRGVGEFSRNLSNIDFEESVIDVRKMLQKYQWKSKGLDGKFPKTKKLLGYENFEKVLHISYQNPNRVCFSKKEFKGAQKGQKEPKQAQRSPKEHRGAKSNSKMSTMCNF